jgi:hypothetical protein
MEPLALTLSLFFGGTVPPQPPGHDWMKYKYWTVYDTTLVQTNPEADNGGAPYLELGNGRKVLLKFGDLPRAVGVAREIADGGILLTLVRPVTGRKPLIRVRRVAADWGEGAGPAEKTRWAATWNARHTASGGSARLWKTPGLGPHDTLPSSAKAAVTPDGKHIAIENLGADLRDMTAREWANFGWVLECDAQQAVTVFSSQAARPALRPLLRIGLRNRAPLPNDYDLSVQYIERSPEYYRYDPSGDAYTRRGPEGVGVMDKPGYADTQKWPKNGEKVTFTAWAKNQGAKPIPGLRWEWRINDVVVSSGRTNKTLEPGRRLSFRQSWAWKADHSDHRDQTVRFAAFPLKPVRECSLNNNVLTDCIEALNMGFWAEQSYVEEFVKAPIATGSYSFEDWVQWQLRIWNDVYMDRSRYPMLAPDGSRERIRAQRITVVPDGTLAGGVHMPGDRNDFHFDGEWGFEWNDRDPQDSKNYIEICRPQQERAFLHEISHQMGLVDLYVQNIDASLPDGTRGKVELKPEPMTTVLTRGMIDPYGGLMGGGDTRPRAPMKRLALTDFDASFDDDTYDLYSSNSIGAFNSNLGYRRGFFGEYMYDLPQRIILRIVGADGKPVPNAAVRVYQQRGGRFYNDPPVFTGVTDADGLFPLPNRPTGEPWPVKVATGHVFRDSPWGRLDVVGGNGVFLVNAQANGQSEWQFAKLHEFNVAYWLGARGTYTCDVKMQMAPCRIAPENLAKGATVTDSRGDIEKENAARLADGDLGTRWFGGGRAGDWVQIDLGKTMDIAEIRLIQNGRAGDFWRRFRIEVASRPEQFGTPAARTVALEPDWQWAAAHRRDVNPTNFDLWTVTYRCAPTPGRYLRVISLKDWGGTLSEMEVRAKG